MSGFDIDQQIADLEKQLALETKSNGVIGDIDLLAADLEAGQVMTDQNLSATEAGFEAGRKGLISSKHTAAAAFNYLAGDEATAVEHLEKAETIDGQIGRLSSQFASFEEFIEDPGFSNFAEMSVFKLGQAVPSAIESFAAGTAGAAVGFTSAVGVGAIPGFVGGVVAKGQMKRMVRDAIIDYSKGNASKEAVDVAQQALKLAAIKSFTKKSAVVGAMSSGYYQGVSSSFKESMVTGQDPTDAAGIAALIGVPFAVADVAPEILFVKSLAKLAKLKRATSPLKVFAGAVVRQGSAETLAEGSQESMIVAQRFQQDPNYDKARAVMRIADSAYSGLVAGGALGGGSGTIKATIASARNILDSTRQQIHEKTAPDAESTINNFEFDDLSPEGMATVPLNELLYAVQDTQQGQTLEADPITQANAAAAIQELNRRAEEMGQNRFQELVRRELAQGTDPQEDRLSEIEQEVFNETDLPEAGATETDLPEAGATEQRTAHGELEEQPQGFEERLLGKNKKGDGYVPGSRAIRTRMKKLQEENPGRQYRLVQKDGAEFIEEVVESSLDVSEIVNEGIIKARSGTKREGKDRTLPATDPQGKKVYLSPIELAHAGMRANNKDKANASHMTYPQLLMSGFLRMNQELADRGFVINLDALPASTVIAKANGKTYTWQHLKKAWAARKYTEEGSSFDGKAAKEERLIETEDSVVETMRQIEQLERELDASAETGAQQETSGQQEMQLERELDVSAETSGQQEMQLLFDGQSINDQIAAAENRLAELGSSREDQASELERNEEVETDTITMSEAQAERDAKKARILDEDGNFIRYSTRRGTKPKQQRKTTPKQKQEVFSKEEIEENEEALKAEMRLEGMKPIREQIEQLERELDASAETGAQQEIQPLFDGQSINDQIAAAENRLAEVAKARQKPKPKPKPKPKVKAKAQPKPKPKPKSKLHKRDMGKVSVWGTFPDLFANYANAIISAVGIKTKVHIIWAEDVEAFNEQNPGAIEGAVIKHALEGKQKAFVAQRDGNAYIFISKNLDSPYRQAITAAILGHELGHVLFKESINSLSEANLARLKKAYQEQLKTKSNKQYTNDEVGFEEWYADQVAVWAEKQTKTPSKFTEAHFKRVAAKMRELWRKSRQFVRRNLKGLNEKQRQAVRTNKDRFTLEETFEQYMGAVLESVHGQESTEQTSNDTEFQRTFDRLQGTPVLTKLREAMQQVWDLGLVDGLLKVILSADQYARVRLGKYGPAFANLFYHRTQTSNDTKGDMLNKQRHALDKWNAQFAEILGEDKEHANKVLAEMQAGVNIDQSIDPKMRKHLADFFERFHRDYLKKRIPTIGKIRNYFPIIYNTQAVQANQTAFIAELKKGGLTQREAQTVTRTMLENDGAFIEDIPHHELFGPQFNAKMRRKLKNMDTKALQDLGFYQNPMVAVQLYLKQATKHAEYNVIKDEAEALINKMPPKQRAQARKIVLGYMGRLGAHIDPTWNKYQSYIAALQFATTLLFSVVASFTDLGNPIVRSKDMDGFKSVLKDWRAYMSKQSREEMIEFAERIGAASREAVQEALHQAYNSEFIDPGARKWSDKYFKMIGLEQWTRMTRIIAANIGRDFIANHAKKAAAGDVRSARYLRELGLDHETATKGYNRETDTIDLATPEGEAVQEAILKFVDESIIRPNPAQRPTWASDPHYMLVWQLKSFFYTFGQIIVGGVAREMQSRWAEGDRAKAALPAMIMFAALLPLAAIALQTREMIKGAFKDDDREDPEQETLDYLFELVDRAGILGPMSVIKMMNDAGDYGRSGVVTALGPTAGTLETFFTGDMGDLAKRLTPIYSQL